MKKIVLSISSVLFLGIFFLTPLRFDIFNTSFSSLFFGPSIGFGVSGAYAGFWDWAADGFKEALVFFWKIIIYDLTQVLAVFSGWFLDFFLKHSITSSSYRTGLIEAGWEIIRDLVNVVFIFSLMIIAFEKVFGNDKSGTNKRLMKTIVVALVINFSLYLTYLIVDSSNILANLFYNRITTEGSYVASNDKNTNFINGLFKSEVKSVSTAVTSHFNPQKIANYSPQSGEGDLEPSQRFILYSLAGMLNIVLATVFFSVGLVFLSRTIGIMILGVLAPLAMATLTIPGAEKRNYIGFDKWFPQLLGLSFTAPVFLFFLYIVVQFASSDGFISTIFVTDVSGNMLTTILSVVLPFAFIAALLFLAKKITLDLAGTLGGMINSYVTKAVAGVAAAGAIVATGGAATVGALSRGAAASGALGNGRLAQGASSVGKLLQTTKFDLNKIPGFQKQLGGLGALGGVLGKGMNTSYADADTAVRRGINSVRTGIDNTLTGKTPDSVKKWQDNVNASNDARINARAENAARKAQEEATVTEGVVSLDENGNIKRDAQGKIIKESHKGKNTKKLLKEKRAQAARMTKEEKKIEEDKIKEEVKKVEEQVKEKKIQTEIEKNLIKTEKNAAVVGDLTKRIRNKEEEMKKLEEDIKTIKNSSVEGTIKQIEDQMKAVANTAKANILKEVSNSQAARIQSVDSSSSEKEKGKK